MSAAADHLLTPLDQMCWRCDKPTSPDDLDTCIGCTTRHLCPACMLTHNCDVRRAMKGLPRLVPVQGRESTA